jgi:hypothetical protein
MPKHLFVFEQGSLVLMDPTSAVVKNVTPNCYLIYEILRYLGHVRNCIDATKKIWLEEMKNLWKEMPYDEVLRVTRDKFLASNGTEEEWLAQVFCISPAENCLVLSNKLDDLEVK